MQHLAFLVFAIIVLVLAAYGMYTYGLPTGINLNAGQNSTSTQRAANTATTNSNANRSNTYYSRPVQRQTANTANNLPVRNIDPSQIPSGFSLKDLSPYFGQVRISASAGGGYLGSYSQINIYNSMPSSAGAINVTGWLLKGNRGNQYVPQAISVYDPSGLTPQSDIFFKNGDTLTIYSTYSGLGRNLRINKCVGYLANTVKFTPPLYQSCPSFNRSEIAGFTGQCQSYIFSLGSCQIPAPNPPVPFDDYGCSQFLSKVNYAGCFQAHRNDYDFLSSQWYIWSGSQFLDYQHDRLLLFDKQGLLVAEYSY